MIYPAEIVVSRPQRWDVPFGDAMSDSDVDALLDVEPFRSMQPDKFPKAIPLRGILKNDTRIHNYQGGDIVVREGDYGNSAFLILRGSVRVVVEGLSPEALGRPPSPQKSFLRSLFSMLQNPSLPEVRNRFRHTEEPAESQHRQAENPSDVRVFLQDFPRILDGKQSVSLHTGEIFGELAALTRTPRTATVIASDNATLLEIRWQGLRELMRRTDSLKQHIDQLYRENSLRVHLRETSLFSELPPEQLEAVARATRFETHGDFQWQEHFEFKQGDTRKDAVVREPLIIEEGTPCNGLLLVRNGFARQSHRYGHGHRTVAYLGKGQAFGLSEAVATSKKKSPVAMCHSLRALGYVDVLRIPQSTLEEHVFPYMPKRRLDQAAAEYVFKCSQQHGDLPQDKTGKAQSQVDPALLEFLVERRFINGQQAMVIDLDRCTRCDDCVRACASTHNNNPRFVRHGHHHGSYMIAHACMHCVDPVCMIGCPTGAIARDLETGTVRINDLTCIGCGTCGNSCPYDNIKMTEIRDSGGAILLDEQTQQPIHKATKCDLCADHSGGPACQHACPHDALVRIDLGNLGELSRHVSRR